MPTVYRAAYPQVTFYYKKYNVTLDQLPNEPDRWSWMIETDKNGPVYWNETNTGKPDIQEVRDWIDAQDWS